MRQAHPTRNPATPRHCNIRPSRFVSSSASRPAGAPTSFARLIAQKLTEKWGQPVVTDNRTGATGFIAMELLKHEAGIDLTHVPYKGSGPATLALLSGQVQTLFANVLALYPHVKAGKLRALAVADPKRNALVPDVPTLAELGSRAQTAEAVPDFESPIWHGVVVSARTPPAVIRRLHAELTRIMNISDAKQRLADLGYEVTIGTPEQFGKRIRDEVAKWPPVVQAMGGPVN